MKKEKKEKILIIKTGYSEFLDKEKDSRIPSLGDVLRATPLLHLYKEDQVTWVTNKEAFPLLENNPYIERLMDFDWITAEQLKSEEFDRIINLEKIPGICALADNIKARRNRYGFTMNSQTGEAEALDKASRVLTVSLHPKEKKKNERTVPELLFEVVGKEFTGQEYILGYKPKSKEIYDMGLNTKVGEKWPTKSWPTKNWNNLGKKLKEDGFKISRQDDKRNKVILRNLRKYIDWINSCKTIISNDSLGLHIALALKKNVFGLFGPTPYKEVYFYERGKAILPEPDPDCMPCFQEICDRKKSCMTDILVEKVYEEIGNYL